MKGFCSVVGYQKLMQCLSRALALRVACFRVLLVHDSSARSGGSVQSLHPRTLQGGAAPSAPAWCAAFLTGVHHSMRCFSDRSASQQVNSSSGCVCMCVRVWIALQTPANV
eukprot:1102243-Pelagomonas_calceolata.AAC.7